MSAKIRRRAVGLALVALALASLALVGCEYFWDVVVPASDHTAPTPAASVIRGGVRTNSWGINPSIRMETSDPSESFYVMAAGIDAGGTHSVTLAPTVTTVCTRSGLAQRAEGHLESITETVEASPGDTVSNGLWTGQFVHMGSYLESPCNPGWTLSSVGYSWWIEAEDFHGNVATRFGGSIVYRP